MSIVASVVTGRSCGCPTVSGMRRVLSLSAVLATIVALFAPNQVDARGRDGEPIRFATFNASLNRSAPGALTADLERALDSDPSNDSAQLQAVLDIVSINDPDVLLINEFDTGTDGDAATVALFAELAGFPYFFTAPSNTGIPSGFDLNNNGTIAGATTRSGSVPSLASSGWRCSPSSRSTSTGSERSSTSCGRTCRARCSRRPPSGARWYSPEELAVFRLSSKSHWDVPITSEDKTVHFLVSHPTPPVFDGPEDRNGTAQLRRDPLLGRLHQPVAVRYIYDDDGRPRRLATAAQFVIAGDQNSDPFDGDSIPGAVQQLLDNPRVNTARRRPARRGRGRDLQGGANLTHRATRDSTRPTSPIQHRATCTPTTCCPRRTCASSTVPCSGRRGPTRVRADRRVSVPIVGPPPRLGRHPA